MHLESSEKMSPSFGKIVRVRIGGNDMFKWVLSLFRKELRAENMTPIQRIIYMSQLTWTDRYYRN